MSKSRDYYCNNKFKNLKIDLEKKITYNCRAAAPHSIDIVWVKNNPGQLFNTETSVFEREQMLRNERNISCEQNCWFAEDRGGHGPRILEKGYERTHFEVHTMPEVVDLHINSDCNLHCTYCCKEYSSTWRNDLHQHGPYVDVGDRDRYSLALIDIMAMKVSQREKLEVNYYQTIFNEFNLVSRNAKRLIITGGEPLLHNSLIKIIKDLPQVKEIKLFTGLGVDAKRFEKMIENLSDVKNLYFCVSMENIGKLYEFNRLGMKWDSVEYKLRLLEKYKHRITIHSTLSNLTMFGFAEFYKQFNQNYKIETELVYQPNFMPIYVMDTNSKLLIEQQLESLEFPDKQAVLESIKIHPSDGQKQHLGNFMKQLLSRHPSLDANIFPASFLQWLNL